MANSQHLKKTILSSILGKDSTTLYFLGYLHLSHSTLLIAPSMSTMQPNYGQICENRFSKSDHFRLSGLLNQIHYMRQGMNDNFNHLKSQILMVEPLPDVTKVFSSILQQEHQLTSSITYESSKNLMENTNNPQVNRIFPHKQGKGRGKPGFQGKP
ncbi:hypothetical protein KIW84_036263 [Lathyrus oleraceus]|uniref:Uncharacterized protein n=1 Tax=Pisum sativum TaxID=3888 RepID=A0A9D4Y3W9_PEA|nr:hypothetical protein KIW84_036263 [Pisum sativum]